MNGKWLMGGLLGFTAVFAIGLWYAQFYAFYDAFEAEAVEIGGRSYAVTAFEGIDATTSPLKLRACFRLEELPDAPPYERAEPLVAPGWFDCFDAKALSQALEAGEAVAFLASDDEFDGTERVVMRYPDGRAFMWRQLDERFAEQ
ncbi:MAG: DUF6446 family protein [Pseudomonadota bacterium]